MKKINLLFKKMKEIKPIIIVIIILGFSLNTSSQNTTKEEFKPSGKAWGYMFGDFYDKLGSDSMSNWGNTEYAKVKKNFIGVSIRRMYLGYDYNMAQNFTAKVLLEGSDAVLTAGGDRTVFIKAANIEWKNILPRHTLIIGQSGSNSFAVSEKAWGYRCIEKTVGDQRGLLNAVDLGVKLEGRFDSLGTFGYTVMYGTGRGNKPEDNRLKKYYIGVDGAFFKGKLVSALNFNYEDQMVAFNNEPKSKSTVAAILAFNHKLFTIGFEGVYQIQKNYKIFDPKVADTSSTLSKDSTDIRAMGISFFVRGTIVKDKLIAFARYDMYSPDLGYSKGDNTSNPYNEAFTTIGIDFSPNKNVHIIPNIWFNSYKDLREKTSGYNVVTGYKSYYERKADFVVRLTFFYTFK